MRVLFYGRLAEAIAPELRVDVPPGCTIGELREQVIADHPEAVAIRGTRVRACIGDRMVRDDHRLGDCQQVEFLAPVSGG